MGRLSKTETEFSFFEKKFVPEPNTGCFLWIGSRYLKGLAYGKFSWKGKYKVAHRVAWEFYRGQVPDGLFVCHKCDTPECVNPDHLFLGTHLDNMADKCRKNRQSHSRDGGGRGIRNSHAKLNEDQVLAIFRRAKGGEKLKALALEYKVSPGLVSMIVTRRIWRHLEVGVGD